jgi:hypothetical protein
MWSREEVGPCGSLARFADVEPFSCMDANGIQLTFRNGMDHHVAPHLQAQRPLLVERTIHVENHETNVPPNPRV